jgi:P-type Ca2+ transporter type 2C
VADLVILDDNFTTIVAAVEEGRGIYESIQTFIRFLLSTNLSELLVVTVGSIAAFLLDLRSGSGNLLVPITAAQLLWINLVTDGAPALALGIDRTPEVMKRPPRNPQSPLLDVPSLRFVLLSGAAKALVAFAILWILPVLGYSYDVTQTATFLFLAAGQLWFAYPARRTDLRPPRNVALHIAVAVTLAVQVLVVLVPWLRSALGTVPLPVPVLAGAMAATLVSWGAAEVVSRSLWRRRDTDPVVHAS